MLATKQTWSGLRVIVAFTCILASAVRADDTPNATLQAAIKAHGGEKNLAKTLIGTLVANAKLTLGPNGEASVSWEETFELPRRYRRNIKGKFAGQAFSMEYAITDGSGWIRENGGKPKEYKGKKLPLSASWNAVLALLPICLEAGVKLGPGGKEMVEGREAVGITVSGAAFGGDAVLFFDSKSALMVKSKRRMPHLLSGQEVNGEVILGDYKEVSGVQYPHRITSYGEGKKLIEMEIRRIELLQKLDDRLFDKP